MINKFKLSKNGLIVHEQKVGSLNAILKAINEQGTPEIEKVTIEEKMEKVNPAIEKVTPEREKYLKDSMKQVSDIKLKAILNRVECVSANKAQPMVPLSKAQSYFIASQGYYLAYDSDSKQVLCLSKSVKDSGKTMVLRKPSTGEGSGVNSIKHLASPLESKSYSGHIKDEGTNLSVAEFQSIIDGKPSIKQLCEAYDRYYQENLDINTSNAKAVW